MLMALKSGKPIKELDIGDVDELVDNLQENQKAMESMEKTWEEKLQEE